jgi:hypothetical protein
LKPAPSLQRRADALFAGTPGIQGGRRTRNRARGLRADVSLREAQVNRFYAGEMPDAAQWLLQNDIDFVLWLKSEGKVPPGTFEKIDEQIRPAFYWQEYYRAGDFRVGIWSRRSHHR